MKGNSCDSCEKADECKDKNQIVLMDNAEPVLIEACSNWVKKGRK
jgi:hypothetical protein